MHEKLLALAIFAFVTFPSISAHASAISQPKNLGHPNCNGCGNPINFATGNKFQKEKDYEGSGPFPIKFYRYYNSQDYNGWINQNSWSGVVSFGERWKFSYSRRVYGHYHANQYGGYSANPPFVGEIATIVRDTGQTLTFKYDGAKWKGDPDITTALSLTPTGWSYVNADDETETYDMAGRPLTITNRAGLTQTLAYNQNGFLASVTDPFGRTLTLTYGVGIPIILTLLLF